MKKVSIVGLGYVGFPLLCAVASANKYDVYGYDLDKKKIEKASKHESTIQDELAESLVKKVNYTVSNNSEILENSDIFIICVPTPIDEFHNPDYTPIISAANTISKYLKKDSYVILESTVNPGTCEEVLIPELEKNTKLKAGIDFHVAHCPERINPGDPKWNVVNIPRNIGSTSAKATKYLADFYRSFLTGIVNEMNTLKEAEATKIIENTFRDINIAYVNELAKSFDILGINLINVIKGASNKPFGFMAHYPSCGVGGHCIPVDPYYLIERAKKAGFDHKFLRTARSINNSMPQYTVDKLVMGLNNIGKSVKGSNIVLLGLSYKKNISDLRESPALVIKKILEEKYEASLRIYDPYNLEMSTHNSLNDVLKDADAVIIATAHDEFIKADISIWKNIPVIIDGQNCLDYEKIKKLNNYYMGIGRK